MTTQRHWWLWPVRIVLIAALLLILFSPRPTDTIVIGGTEKAAAFSFPTYIVRWSGRAVNLDLGPGIYKITQDVSVNAIYRNEGKKIGFPVDTRVTAEDIAVKHGIGWEINVTWHGWTKLSNRAIDFGFNWTERVAGTRSDCWARRTITFGPASGPGTAQTVRADSLRKGCD